MTRVILFAKAPLPGQAKTRLIPALGATGSAELAERMLHHTLAECSKLSHVELELCLAPSLATPFWREFDFPGNKQLDWQFSEQGGGDLGERLANAVREPLQRGEAVLMIGSDCPALTAERLNEMIVLLQQTDAVICPSHDGGYVALGLQRWCAEIFQEMPWSTNTVAALTLERLAMAGLQIRQLPPLHDIDLPEDLPYLPEHWHYPGIITDASVARDS